MGRRTLFRYYRSKNDIPWGQFDRSLEAFREIFRATPPDLDLRAAIGRAIVEFNRFPDDASPSHEERMRLILETPALQAHSALRYAEWRRVIAEYAARRLGGSPDDVAPRLLGYVGLGVALAAYETWLADPEQQLTAVIEASVGALRELDVHPPGRPDEESARS
ncbi:mycofactocin system transcriptional regulator [Nocardioides daphniae]|uniref:acyl-CoA-like ligand-binding transcription factor n=1 Tax=Nocardioides daphniae TaxID=402297 RepID=UPI00193106D0|nr:mycofactocin system transcriptional regulator [Nocardioides daphniae]